MEVVWWVVIALVLIPVLYVGIRQEWLKMDNRSRLNRELKERQKD